MKILFKKIPPKYFLLSQFFLLLLGLIFLFGIYYITYIQYKVSDNLFSQGPVTSPPKSFSLSLDQPADDSLVFDSQILISGKTSPNMNILISTDTKDLMIKSKSDGTFSQSFTLDLGINNIKVLVFDKTGDAREEERVVFYSEEKI